MDVLKAILERRSIRNFLDKEIPEEIISVLLLAAIRAPNAGNIQHWKFIVVKDKEKRKQLAKAAYDQQFIAEAPINIVICADLEKIKAEYGERGERVYSVMDVSAAAENLILAAWNFGIGSCWVSAFDEEEVRIILNLPPEIKPFIIIPLGYPKKMPEKTDRIPVENVSFIDEYGKKYEEAKGITDLLLEELEKVYEKTKSFFSKKQEKMLNISGNN